MLIENTLYGQIDKVAIAIQRIKLYSPVDKIPILSFSGGKDSLVIYHLAKMAGIEFKAQYSPTSVDPPELIKFIKEKYPEVERLHYKKNPDGTSRTMWYLLSHRAMPPTRLCRYCCDELKERTGEIGDTIITGVRWEESNKRKGRKVVEFYKGKIVLSPINDWSEDDVWEFIKTNNIPYCELYDKGFKRLGCIGCPLSSNQKKELEMYPKYRENYIKAFEKMLKYRESKGMTTEWKTGDDVMNWWIGESAKTRELDGQCSLYQD